MRVSDVDFVVFADGGPKYWTAGLVVENPEGELPMIVVDLSRSSDVVKINR